MAYILQRRSPGDVRNATQRTALKSGEKITTHNVALKSGARKTTKIAEKLCAVFVAVLLAFAMIIPQSFAQENAGGGGL